MSRTVSVPKSALRHSIQIERFSAGSALVRIYEITPDITLGKLIAEYETAGKGATASARRELKRIEAR